MAFFEFVQKDIAMCKMQRAMEKRMQPLFAFKAKDSYISINSL